MRFIYALLVLSSCAGGDKKEKEISVKWENGKAVAILVPRNLLDETQATSLTHSLLVHLSPGDRTPAIMGNYQLQDDYAIFIPLIPFTHGLEYEVRLNKKLVGTVKIPADQTQPAPTVLNVYPSQDTLPQNLLKFYIHFSKPMYGSRALDHITLIKNGTDTLRHVFLDMTTELWNSDNTILTLWLDPGRIKRDLQPNKEMGPPLELNTSYELIIQPEWSIHDDTIGQKGFHKKFVTGKPDYLSPDINKWVIELPPDPKNPDPLIIRLDESLDVILLDNTIRITDSVHNEVAGRTATYENGTVFHFIPDSPWSPGKYTLEVEGRLEDMAGNNLNRPFDNDLQSHAGKKEKKIFTRTFTIK